MRILDIIDATGIMYTISDDGRLSSFGHCVAFFVQQDAHGYNLFRVMKETIGTISGLTVAVQTISKTTVIRHLGKTAAYLKSMPDRQTIVALLELDNKKYLSNYTFEAVKDMTDALGFISSWGDYKIRAMPSASA